MHSNFLKVLLLATLLLLITGCVKDEKKNGRLSELSEHTAVSKITVPASQMTVDPKDKLGLRQLTIIVDKTALNKDENTTVRVQALYDDGTSKDVTEKVEWIVAPKDAVSITKDVLVAKKDTHTTVKAKLGDVASNSVALDIIWIMNGYTLPPEPDPKVNNATLLGVDVNNNGVRDDVERWIYETYKDKHPIHVDIAMQAARAYKLVLEHPEKAKEIRKKVNSAIHCNWYYRAYAEFFNQPVLMKKSIVPSVRSQYFNTKERQKTYWQYDTLLNGGVYDLPDPNKLKLYCDFNTSKYDN